MGQSKRGVLSINNGSSSIRFALYQIGEPMERMLAGEIDRIGLSGTNLTFSEASHGQQVRRSGPRRGLVHDTERASDVDAI